ncbi:MFS transporter [Actinoallomurus bryophytorum]|uniref:EmrB/QacA subfamily drug resistance transporter n=1 Tax=Actinoallomurus bryophytorum TaxID=1490222 RepID=A0A543CIM0_9ACTN|nr:MFS transporter [Actinoallomurus bryophytorum]TQL96952.1 EmrB/QacA subfamily drug resistance transporter [Actinoallomurus bryophytorum]
MSERLETAGTGTAGVPRSPLRGGLVLVLVSAGQFLATLDLFVVNVAFPSIHADFPGATNSGLSWVLSAYAIAFAALLVPSGRLADRYGRRRLFRAGMTLFAVASAGCAASPWLGLLVAWRAVQAGGAALMVPTSLGLLLAVFPERRHRNVVAIWSVAGAVGSALGPFLGGLLVEADWRWIFVLNLPIALVVVYAVRNLPETRSGERGGLPDLVGAALFAAGVAAAVAALANANTWGAGSLGLWLCLSAAVVALVAFVRRSARHPRPAINLALLRQAGFAFANLAMICFFVGFAMVLLATILFLTTVWHYGSVRAGLAFVPAPAIAIPAGLLTGRLSTPRRTLAVAGATMWCVAGILWFVSLGDQPAYVAGMLPGLLICGVGFGLFAASIIGAGTAVLPPDWYATGTGMINAARQTGSAAGVALAVALIGAGTSSADYRSSWLGNCGFGALAAVFALGTGRKTVSKDAGGTS